MASKIQKLIEAVHLGDEYENLHLPETDLLGEYMEVSLHFDGCTWSAKLGTSYSDIGHFCWVEDGKLQRDNTLWENYDTPEEALQALQKQCMEMRSRKAIIVSADQLFGDGYAYDPLFADDVIEME